MINIINITSYSFLAIMLILIILVNSHMLKSYNWVMYGKVMNLLLPSILLWCLGGYVWKVHKAESSII